MLHLNILIRYWYTEVYYIQRTMQRKTDMGPVQVMPQISVHSTRHTAHLHSSFPGMFFHPEINSTRSHVHMLQPKPYSYIRTWGGLKSCRELSTHSTPHMAYTAVVHYSIRHFSRGILVIQSHSYWRLCCDHHVM